MMLEDFETGDIVRLICTKNQQFIVEAGNNDASLVWCYQSNYCWELSTMAGWLHTGAVPANKDEIELFKTAIKQGSC